MSILECYNTHAAVCRASAVCGSELAKLELEHLRAGLAQLVTGAEAVCEAQPSWSSACGYQDTNSKFASASDAWALLKRRLVKSTAEAGAVFGGR